MPMKTLAPHAVHQHLSQGAILVDIRSADEYAREHIREARHIPLDQLKADTTQLSGETAVVFHCRSGHRTQMNAEILKACVPGESYLLEGGLDAWKQAGLPVTRDASQPLELQRQVQIVAGSMVVLGTVLGATVSPGFLLLAGLVGAGLVFAGVSGFCGLARLLMKMPWNK
ncbi:rhodanese family protein [Halopseudomonas pertucinogena]|uniref:Inner membrane protein YgaP n=1 Tax=Halopseudomonas pertucinogena TaxID=86175 RepID=A0ABQ2CIZ9_9GAMM|nr:rhodanese family protein [Halopseudomonas pertucinogena]GGI89526.1 inner membrane protein YgaP [Halopseudomonas pertucinogena]